MIRKKVEKEYEPKVKVLKTNFADMRAGQIMAIATPRLIAQVVKTIPKGAEWSLTQLRTKLAKNLRFSRPPGGLI